MKNYITSVGTLRYSENWLLIDCDPEIGQYYRELYSASVWRTDKLNRPKAKEHITVISKYDKPNKRWWGFDHGQSIEFSYNPTECEGCETYIWLPVICPRALEIRSSLGCYHPYYPLHLTIGNRK